MIVKKAQRISIEAVVRGYLAGSAWDEYKKHKTISGNQQPGGLQESQLLPQPLFTPTTKADSGHDIPLSEKDLSNANIVPPVPAPKSATFKFCFLSVCK